MHFTFHAMSKTIEHIGTVASITADKMYVRISQHSACHDCHAKSACVASSSADKQVVIDNFTGNYSTGETVMVYGKTSTGLLAVLLAFVIPFCIILFSLFIFQQIFTNEALSALLALATLVPYYFILSLSNKKLTKKLTFSVRKMDDV